MTDIDILMQHVGEINAKPPASLTDSDLTVLVGYYRHQRARRAEGHKIAKPAAPKLDLLGLLNMTPTKPKLAPGSVRRLK